MTLWFGSEDCKKKLERVKSRRRGTSDVNVVCAVCPVLGSEDETGRRARLQRQPKCGRPARTTGMNGLSIFRHVR